MQRLLRKLFQRENLTRAEAREAMSLLMRGETPPEQVGAFLAALRVKGETIDEIAGCAEGMRAHAHKLPVKRKDILDTCGTGGDGLDTFNISTTNGFVVAGAGLGVVKHGNRAVSSRSGSADVLEALGIKIDIPIEKVAEQVDQIGFGFLFARTFHPAVKNVAPIRQSLGARTVFNLLGPLVNPAGSCRQLIGVYAKEWVEKVALVLKELGSEEVLVVHGEDGMDEITISGKTDVAHLSKGKVRTFTIEPDDVGLPKASLTALKGGDAHVNAKITEGILQGETGPCRDIVVLNAAAALWVAGKARSLAEGRELAEKSLDSKAAHQVLERLRRS